MTPAGERWADLRTRVLSALIMIAVAAFEIWEGGLIFNLGVCVVVAAMVWEVAVMTGPSRRAPISYVVAAVAGLSLLAWDQFLPRPWGWTVLALAPLAVLASTRRDRRILSAYSLAIMLAGTGLLMLRAQGAGLFMWLVLIVVASDTLGYFAGRLIGGPRFWPAVSPKKTWSGTVAGWIGALCVGVGFGLAGYSWTLVALSPVVAFAGQLGDIAESAIKRRAGIKDSSNLIPGHGGMLDRFDALLGAVLALQIWVLATGGLV